MCLAFSAISKSISTVRNGLLLDVTPSILPSSGSIIHPVPPNSMPSILGPLKFDERQKAVSDRINKLVVTIAGLDERFDPSLFFGQLSSVPGLSNIPQNIIIRGIGEASHRAIFNRCLFAIAANLQGPD